MAYITLTVPPVGDPLRESLFQLIADNQDIFDARTSAEGTPINGSYELPSGAGKDPTDWTKAVAGSATGSTTVTESEVSDGRQAYKANVSMDGDTLTLTSDSYTLCHPGQRIEVEFLVLGENATMDVKLELLWWYWNGSAWTAATDPDTAVYDVSTIPTSYTPYRTTTRVPTTGAHLPQSYQIRWTFGGTGGSSTLYDVFVDGLKSRVYSGLVTHGKASAGNPLATITTNTTTTLTLPSSMIDEENPNWALIWFDVDWRTTSVLHSIQDPSGNVFCEIKQTEVSPQIYKTGHIFVPLDNNHQFKIVTSGGSVGAGSGTVVYVGGFFV